jgi:drug/metabolite transporter (DMT)-like permease
VSPAEAAAPAAAGRPAAGEGVTAVDCMPSRQRGRWRPAIALVVLSLAWGFTWVLAKQGLAYAPPFAFAAQRCVGGALALFLALKLLGRPMRLVAPAKTLVIALINVAAFLIFQTWALVEGGAGQTAVLNYTMPIWTLLLAWPFLGERIGGPQWLAAICALGGLMLIIEPWSMHISLLSRLLGLMAAVSWAVGTILIKHLRSRCEVDLISLTAWQLLLGAAPLLLLAVVIPDRSTVWSGPYIGILAFMAIVSTALCWWLWIYILDRVPAWEAGLSVLGTPVVALLSSRLLLGEEFHITEILGMLMIGVGLALLSLSSWMASRQAAPRPD